MIVGVPHTGTRFVHSLFGGEFYHIGEKDIPDITPVIVPLRMPHRIIVSCERRGGNLDVITSQFHELIRRYKDPYYLPIDAEDRQDYLDKINQELNLNVHTDWKPIGRYKSYLAEWKDVQDKERAKQFIQEFQSFFERFYGRI